MDGAQPGAHTPSLYIDYGATGRMIEPPGRAFRPAWGAFADGSIVVLHAVKRRQL